MLKLEENDYDLNFLCSFTFDFQMLKDILIKLVKSNQILQKRIIKLEKTNKEKENRITAIEDKINIIYIPEQNSYSDEEDNGEKNEKEEKKERKEKEEKKEMEKNFIEEKKEINIEEKEIKKNNEPQFEREKGNEIDEDDEKKINSRRSLLSKKSLREIESRNSFVQQFPQVSHETIKSLLKLIRENSEKIGKIEKNLSKKLNNSINDLVKNFNDLYKENEKEHKFLKEKIKDINDRLYDYNDKMDGIIVKTAPLDTLTIFRDNGNGNMDSTKVMVKMLEEKVNKKIEIIENKNKGENIDNNKFNDKIKELEDNLNQINGELNKIKNGNKNIGINLNSQNYDEDIQELKILIDKKYNDIIKIIEDLSPKIKNGELIEDKLEELMKKIKTEKEIKSPKEKIETKINKTSEKEKKIEGDININLSSDLKDRIKELNKKLNDIDNYFKNLFNNTSQDIGEIKTKIKEMDFILEKKITKDDLKSLEHKTEEHDDSIKYLQETAGDFLQSINKLSENNPTFVKRLESLTYEVQELKGRGFKENSVKPLDMSKYVEENKLKEIIKIINQNIEDINKEKNSILIEVREINENLNLLETKERIIKLEDNINTKINDIYDKINKKNIDKLEINKYLKNLDIKIKSLDTQQKDADSWILAKQPIGCFNCASCESNIKKISNSNEYIPWNKYPHQERQYHMGQGFSRLLQKIGNDGQKNINEKERYSDYEFANKSNYFNNITNVKGNNKSHFFFKINNRETMKEEISDISNSKISKHHILPKVRNKRKTMEQIPLTDDENDIRNNSMDNSNSPKIMKITKKNISGNFILINSHKKTVDDDKNYPKLDSALVKPKLKLDKIKSLPNYENA